MKFEFETREEAQERANEVFKLFPTVDGWPFRVIIHNTFGLNFPNGGYYYVISHKFSYNNDFNVQVDLYECSDPKGESKKNGFKANILISKHKSENNIHTLIYKLSFHSHGKTPLAAINSALLVMGDTRLNYSIGEKLITELIEAFEK